MYIFIALWSYTGYTQFPQPAEVDFFCTFAHQGPPAFTEHSANVTPATVLHCTTWQPEIATEIHFVMAGNG